MRIVTFLQSFGQGPVRPRTPPQPVRTGSGGRDERNARQGPPAGLAFAAGLPGAGERREGTARGVPLFKMKCEDKP